MLTPLVRLPKLVRLIEQETYFVIHAPRQIGKTTTILSLAAQLNAAGRHVAAVLSVEIGALIAGVALSLSPFSYEIGARVKPLRDFFIILFFILLGSQLVIGNLGELLFPAFVLSIFICCYLNICTL